MNATSTSINATHDHAAPIWPLCISQKNYITIACFTTPVTIVGVLVYLGVLLTFLRHRYLINAFTVNVVALTIIGIIHGVGFFPMAMLRPITSEWLNHPLNCAIFQYFMWVLPTMAVLQDLVICLDRWAAFIAPFWYREKSSMKHSLLLTAITVIWMHAWYLPLNILNYRTPMALRYGCDGTAYGWYQKTAMAMVSQAPEVLIYGSDPILLFLMWRRKRKRIAARSTAHIASQSLPKSSNGEPLAHGQHRRASGPMLHSHSGGSVPVKDSASREARSANRLVLIVLGLKVTAILSNMIPATLFVTGRPPPCAWDAFHLSEQFMAVILVTEPIVYLAALQTLRGKSLSLSCAWIGFLSAFKCTN